MSASSHPPGSTSDVLAAATTTTDDGLPMQARPQRALIPTSYDFMDASRGRPQSAPARVPSPGT